MSQNNGISSGTLLLALVGGAAAGAGLALLFAPQSGRRTRRALGDLAEDAQTYAKDMMHKAGGGIERAKRKGEAWMRRGQELAEEAGRAAAAAGDKGAF